MAIWADARQRWREGRVGLVPLLSVRGVAAVLLLSFTLFAVIALPLFEGIRILVTGDTPEPVTITRDLLLLNLAFNVIAMLVIPIFVVWISRPGQRNALAERLGLRLDSKTHLWAFLGAGVTFAAMLVLGGLLAALDYFGIYHAEESALVPQLDAILTLPLVFLIPIIAAVTEEVFFRGLLQPRIGLLATSLLFGIVHIGYGTWLQIVAPILLGLLFGVLYERTKSLWAPIAGHFTFDFIELVALYVTEPSGE